MSRIGDNSYHKFISGEIVDADASPTGADLNPIFKIFQTAINDNFDRIPKSFVVLNPDGSTKATQTLDTAINHIKFKEGTNVTLSLDASGILTLSVAISTESLPDGAVTTPKIANNAITTNKIADGSITGIKLATGAVSESRLADNSVSTLKLVDGAVNHSKIADGNVINSKLADGAVTTPKLANDSVSSDKIQNQAITANKLALGVVSNSFIANNAVDSNKIAADSVITVKIANNAVISGKIADGAVTTTKVADGAVTTAKLASDVTNSITNKAPKDHAHTLIFEGAEITGTAVIGEGTSRVTLSVPQSAAFSGTFTKVYTDLTGRVVGGGTLSESDIPQITLSKVSGAGTAASRNTGTAVGNVPIIGADGQLDPSIIPGGGGGGGLADNSVTTPKIANGAVTNAKLSNSSVTVNNIVDGAVTGSKLADGAIGGTKLGSLAVSTDKIADSAVTMIKLAPEVVNAIGSGGGGGSGDMTKAVYDTDNNGVVDQASKLQTARTISLTGDVTGSTTFDGSANASITASIPAATTSAKGTMSAADKTKLDGIATNANNYTHPANHPPSIITQDASNRFVTDAEKTTWNAKAPTTAVTTSANGLMIAADKSKLDGIEAGANNYTHPANHPASIITQDSNNRFVTDAEKTAISQIRKITVSNLDANVSAMQEGEIWIKYK